MYDPFGRRIRKEKLSDSPPATRPMGCEYQWSGDQLIAETPLYADGRPAYEESIHWLYAPGGLTPLAREEKGRLHYVVSDHMGTPRELLTEQGKRAWAGRLSLWGRGSQWAVAANDADKLSCNLRFAGQYEDEESGLHYNRFRYYDTETGQYLTPDPIGLAGGLDLYAYVKNPLTWIDPLGLACCPSINAEHIFHGEINRRGRGVGFHHEGSIGHQGKARVTQIIDLPNSQGVYRGKVEIFDSSTGQWVAKGPESTFLPKSWNRSQVMSEVRGAYNNGTVLPNGKWSGVSPGGVKIEGWLDSSGNINTAYPIY